MACAVACINQPAVGSIDAQALLAGHVGSGGRSYAKDYLNLTVVVQVNLPLVQVRTGSAGVGAHAELHYTQRVTVGVGSVQIAHIVAVVAIAVASKEVNLRVVDAGIRRTERGAVVACARHRTAKFEVAVGIDGELCVGILSEGESESQIVHRGDTVVAGTGSDERSERGRNRNPLRRVGAGRE